MSAATLQGFVCAKPHGYAGDFEIIDRIYQRHVSPEPRLARWDHYFHSQPAVAAVRNRKTYFHELLRAHRRSPGAAPLRVLVVGSGPGRDLLEYLSASPDAAVRFDCVEIDANAIAHATALNAPFSGQLVFHHRNALRFRTDDRFDLVWAAGLFDYFDDRLFVAMLKRLRAMLADDGALVVGNFSSTNPSRGYMEFGEWRLHHRTAAELLSLATASGASADRQSVGAEAEGVNLFLHLS